MAQIFKRAAKLAMIACLATSAVTASAATQAPVPTPATVADVKAGAAVRDSKGVQVATMVEVQGSNVVLDTGQTKIAVPMTFLMKDAQGVLLNITADQFNAAIAKAHARAEAAKAQQAPQQDQPPKH